MPVLACNEKINIIIIIIIKLKSDKKILQFNLHWFGGVLFSNNSCDKRPRKIVTGRMRTNEILSYRCPAIFEFWGFSVLLNNLKLLLFMFALT